MLKSSRQLPISELAVVGAVFAVAATFLSNSPARGAPIDTVDQQQTIINGFGASINSTSPVGQSFTPSLSGLDAFDLLLSEQVDLGGSNVFVRIRDGSIGGTILGTSASVSIPDGMSSTIIHFDFAATVPLTPNSLYIMEAVATGGDVFWRGNIFDPYSGGEAIVEGEAFAGADFWFREGLHAVPEPSSLALAAVGAVSCLRLARRGRKA